MATYAVTTSDVDNWGDSSDRFKTRSPADQRLREKVAAGHSLVRLIRWQNDQPTVVERIAKENTNLNDVSTPSVPDRRVQQTVEDNPLIPMLKVEFWPTPFTFVEVPGLVQLWHAPERLHKGVYLWCIELNGGYLVNYVGKTTDKGGFETRLGTELKDCRLGRYTKMVDLEAFKQGRRIVLDSPLPGHLERQNSKLEPVYRILLAPIDSDADCRQVESTIVSTLKRNPFTEQFVANGKGYRPKVFLKVQFAELPRIIGLNCSVPEELEAASVPTATLP
jgi:hypothetical protein